MYYRFDEEMDATIRPLPKAFKDLEKFKRETLEMLKTKCKDHEDRIH